MRLMVTGGAGFIGSAVIRQAIADGHTVLNVDKLTYAANLENLTPISDSPNYEFVEADICDGKKMAELVMGFRPDTIMHLAAESHVDRSIDGPAAFIETNIIGTFRLLEAARDYKEAGAPEGFRFHHISTDEVFGSLGATGEFTEESNYRPNSPYSASKASSDMLVRAWGETFGLPVVISNCSNNYGPYQFPEKLIPVVIDAARGQKPIPVYGKGENVRDWLYVGDHASALLLVASEGVPGETYNVGGRAEMTNIDLVRTICRLMDERFPANAPHEKLITFVTDRPGHDLRYAVDCSKIERELGWTPAKTLEEGMAETVDWYLENDEWADGIRQRGFDGARLGLGGKGQAMRILITGGTGQVGTHLREEATKCGWEAVAPGRDELDLMNLEDPNSLDLAGIDGVINSAAFTGVDAAESEEAAARQLNAVAPGILAEACARAGVPLVHYSTDYVFDGSSKEPYTEESQTSPLGVYGATKLDGEKAVASVGGTHAILRLSWVFSAQGRNFVKTMLRLAAAHGGVRVVDDQYGRPTPAWSAAIAGLQVFEALLVEPEKAGIYHFSGDKTVTWAEFAKEIFEAAGLKIPVTPIPTSDFPTPASRPAFSVMDCAKIHEVFGIPMADWRKELQLVIKELGPVEEWTS